MAHEHDTAPRSAREVRFALTTEGLALELGSAFDPSPPLRAPRVSRLIARLRARIAAPRHAALSGT